MKEAGMLSVNELTVTLGEKRILDRVSFEIREHELVSILGPNGSGKTTLLRAILGLVKSESGRVSMYGKSIADSRKSIGYVPQLIEKSSDFPITVKDAVMSGMYRPFKKYDREDEVRTNEVMEIFSVKSLSGKRLYELSGGELQRVLMARAVAGRPKLLLLDEPTSSVDKKSHETFFRLLADMTDEMAIILVTHDLGAVSTNIKRIICLNGRVNYDGPTAEGMSKLEETYMGSISIIDHSHGDENV